jgi:hypothetical protein
LIQSNAAQSALQALVNAQMKVLAAIQILASKLFRSGICWDTHPPSGPRYSDFRAVFGRPYARYSI